MMPLHMAPFANQTEEVDDDVEMNAVLNQLIREGVGELVAADVPYKQLLTGELAVRGDFVSYAKFRRAFLDALRSSNKFLVFTQDQPGQDAPMGSEAAETMALLDGQLYKTGNQIRLALQLIDARSNKTRWSGIFAEPLVKSEPDLGR